MMMADYDMSIHQNPSAMAWAEFYTKMRNTSPDPANFDNEGNMIGWFANAMMAMHDHLHGGGPINGDQAEYMASVPAPAVPDDVAGLIERLRAAYDRSSHVRMTWPCVGEAADALEAQAAELARLREENALMAASLDEEERKHGLSTNGNMWRFWSQQLREYHERRAKERAALTHPTGDLT